MFCKESNVLLKQVVSTNQSVADLRAVYTVTVVFTLLLLNH